MVRNSWVRRVYEKKHHISDGLPAWTAMTGGGKNQGGNFFLANERSLKRAPNINGCFWFP